MKNKLWLVVLLSACLGWPVLATDYAKFGNVTAKTNTLTITYQGEGYNSWGSGSAVDEFFWEGTGTTNNGIMFVVPSAHSICYYSTDGIWASTNSVCPWEYRYGSQLVSYNGLLWLIAGHGGISMSDLQDVWYSPNGTNWTQATASGGFGGRTYHTVLVYNNLMWLMGGLSTGDYNDVWYSSNGTNWTRATAHAGWSGRHAISAYVYNNKMWVVAGRGGPDYYGYNDSWYSSDGTNWTQATASAAFTGRSYAGAAVFQNKMFILGGFESNTTFKADLWYSTDGATWVQGPVPTWAARASFPCLTYNNKIWVAGGSGVGYIRLTDSFYSYTSANTNVSCSLDANGNLLFGSSLLPTGTSSDLGSVLYPWRDLYLSTNSIYMGGVKVLKYNPTLTQLEPQVRIYSPTGVTNNFDGLLVNTVVGNYLTVSNGAFAVLTVTSNAASGYDVVNWQTMNSYVAGPGLAGETLAAVTARGALSDTPLTLDLLTLKSGLAGSGSNAWSRTLRDSSAAYNQGAASSSDGKYLAVLAAGATPLYVYTSTDYGTNWTQHGSSLNWTKITSDSSGKYLAATVTGGQLYTSPDYGTNWTARSVNRSWSGIASSSDGKNLVACQYVTTSGRIYTSTDYGTNWTQQSASVKDWKDVASSSDGTKLVAVAYDNYIYTSTDAGTNWTQRGSSNLWTCVASSSDGTKLIAGAYANVYTSTDSGVTWAATGVAGANVVAISSDGSRLVFGNLGNLYTSKDFGTNWTSRAADVWSGIAGSSDLSKMVGLASYKVYTMDWTVTSLSPLSGFSFNQSLIPTSSNTYDIGSLAYPFRDLYVGSNSVWMAGIKMFSISNGQMVVGLPVASSNGTTYLSTSTGGLTNNQAGVSFNGEFMVLATNSASSLFGDGRGGLVIGGPTGVDKNLLWLDGTKPTFSWNTYRNESGKYFYLSDYEARKDLMTASRSGRFGINKMNNLLTYHTLTSQSDMSSDLELDATKTEYTPNYQLVYLVTVTATNTVADLYSIQTSRDSGATFTTVSTGNTMFLTSTNIGNGIWMYWTATTGHTVGETRKFLGVPQLPRASLSVSPMFIDEVMINTNLFGTAAWIDRTYEANSSQYGELRPFRAGTNSAMYMGMTIPNNSFYINITTAGVGVAYTLEYWNGSAWTSAVNWVDGTAQFTQSGDITLDATTMTSWTTNLTVDTYTNLYYWIRMRSTNIVTTTPYVQDITRHGANRFQVYDAPLDDTPTMKVDAGGNTWVGGLPMSAATVQTFYYKFLAQCPNVATALTASATVPFSTEVSDSYNVYTNSTWYPNSANMVRMNWSIRASTTQTAGRGFYVVLFENGVAVRDLDTCVSGDNADIPQSLGTYIFKPSNATNYYQVGLRRFSANDVITAGGNTNWWFGEKIQ